VFCVGFVTASGSIDEGINHEAWLGLQDAKSEGLAQRIDYIATVDARDRAKNISYFAGQGYDLIITVGAALSNDTVTAALSYPKILFIGVEQPQPTKYPNLTGLVFHEENSGYLAGALAALVTHTNQVAAVCEDKSLDAMRRYCEGFKAGALSINSKIKIDVSYRKGSSEKLFNDPGWGSATAMELVNGGADVLFAAGGATGEAALETAAKQGAAVIGSETDAYAGLTDIRSQIVSSALNDIRSGVLNLMRLSRKENFPSGEYFGSNSLASFHDWEPLLSQSILNQLKIIKKGLDDKTIQIKVPYKSP
jgi:basic membrane protein A